MFIERKVDAVLGFPPVPQELRARKIGHAVVNTALDRPWSQYFCCMTVARQDFVRKHPVATKRALRAIVKATDICAAEPERVARMLVDRGFTAHQDATLQVVPVRNLIGQPWRSPDTCRKRPEPRRIECDRDCRVDGSRGLECGLPIPVRVDRTSGRRLARRPTAIRRRECSGYEGRRPVGWR